MSNKKRGREEGGRVHLADAFACGKGMESSVDSLPVILRVKVLKYGYLEERAPREIFHILRRDTAE